MDASELGFVHLTSQTGAQLPTRQPVCSNAAAGHSRSVLISTQSEDTLQRARLAITLRFQSHEAALTEEQVQACLVCWAACGRHDSI